MASIIWTFNTGFHAAPRTAIAALLALAIGVVAADRATAQITAKTLIGDAVSDPDDAKYSDVSEAIKRYTNKDVLGAKQFLESAKRKDARLPPVNLMMAKLYFLSRQNQNGLAALEATARDDPGDPEPYLLLADQAIAAQQAIQASALYDKAIELIDKYDDNPRRKRKFVIRAHAGRSAVLQRWQDWAQAEADIQKWMEADPDDANAHSRLGFVLFMQGREKDGYDAFTKAKSLNDELPSPYVSAASMYQRLATQTDDGKQEAEYQKKAEQSFLRAYQEDKENVTTLIAYSEYLIRTGQLEKAAQVLAAARAAQENSFQIQLLSGVQAQMIGDVDAAEKYYVQTLGLSPGNRDANNQLALLLVASDDDASKARGEAIARNNAKLNPNNADVNMTLAWVLRQVGKGSEANEAYQKAIRQGTLSADSTLLLAKLLVEQKRGDVAKGLLENALKREQGIFINRSQAEALLETL